MTKYFLKKRQIFLENDKRVHRLFCKNHYPKDLETAAKIINELHNAYIDMALLVNNYSKFHLN